MTVHSSTVTANTATNPPGGLYNTSGSSMTIYNTIFWNNGGNGEGDQYAHLGEAANFTIQFSCVEGGGTSNANLNSYPQFTDEGGGDFRLLETSPVIDAGFYGYLPTDTTDTNGVGVSNGCITVDAAGGTRVSGSAVDIGAFEYQQ